MNNDLGKIIAEQRKKLNISQDDLANYLFCARSAVSHLENGTREYRMITCYHYQKY